MIINHVKERAQSMGRHRASPSVRFALKQVAARLQSIAGKACFWRWELTRLPAPAEAPGRVMYFGRSDKRALAVELLGLEAGAGEGSPAGRHGVVWVSELPLPNSVRVPAYLRAVVPLGGSLEAIVAAYPENLRRSLRRQRVACHTRPVTDEVEMERVDREMLRPYALARHGASAAQVSASAVQDIAKGRGRLTLVLCGTEEVGCHLGFPQTRAGVRFWVSVRFGFPKAVFDDRKRLREINSVNTYFEMEAAHRDGCAHYDIGDCLGRPDDGLLQWKSARGGHLDAALIHEHFYVLLPEQAAPAMLWHAPIFGEKAGTLTLHLGLPEGRTDDQALARFRELRFSGMHKICLHCARAPGAPLVNAVRALCARTPVSSVEVRLAPQG